MLVHTSQVDILCWNFPRGNTVSGNDDFFHKPVNFHSISYIAQTLTRYNYNRKLLQIPIGFMMRSVSLLVVTGGSALLLVGRASNAEVVCPVEQEDNFQEQPYYLVNPCCALAFCLDHVDFHSCV